jgi:hypothetical protein
MRATRAAGAGGVRAPGPAAPLPVRQDQLERAVRGHRHAIRPVQKRQRLRGGQRRGHGGEHGVAGRRPGPGEGGLGQDLGPQRVGVSLAQVHAMQAGRTSRPYQRSHHADRLPGPQRQVRHPVADQLAGQPGQRQPGQDHQIRYGAVVHGKNLRGAARDGPGRPLLPRRPEVGQDQPGRRQVSRRGRRRVSTADVTDPGSGQETRHARPGPPRAVHADVGAPPPRQRARPAVPVRVSQRRGRHLRRQPGPELRRQRAVQTAGEVVEHSRRGQHREHPPGRRGRHAVLLRRGDHRVPVPAPVQQGEHGRRLPQPGHRHRPPRIHPELQRVPVPPHRQQSRLQGWPHAHMLTPPPDIPRPPAATRHPPPVGRHPPAGRRPAGNRSPAARQSSPRTARLDSTSPVPTPPSASTGTT